jgi:hypothetical protein
MRYFKNGQAIIQPDLKVEPHDWQMPQSAWNAEDGASRHRPSVCVRVHPLEFGTTLGEFQHNAVRNAPF